MKRWMTDTTGMTPFIVFSPFSSFISIFKIKVFILNNNFLGKKKPLFPLLEKFEQDMSSVRMQLVMQLLTLSV